MKTLKKLWRMLVRSKTNMFAAALAGLSTLQLAVPSFASSMTPERFTALGVVIAAAIAYLRSLVKEPLKDKVER